MRRLAANSESSTHDPAAAPTSALPTWLGSLVLHLVLLLLLGLTVQFTPPSIGVEPVREVGVVLKHQAETDIYEGEDDAQIQAEAASAAVAQSDPLPSESPVDLSEALPESADLPGVGVLGDGGPPSASGFADGAGANTRIAGGKGRTSVFGLEAEGYKFVYVFDRSGSMGGGSRSPLRAAKAELLASLKSLGRTHQFQIIFYNDLPTQFDLSGRGVGLVFADQRGKELARRFIEGITAFGATRHEEALSKALRMRPDVIFFLTDADEPALSAAQLDRISKLNGGLTTIHSIEFGLGPQKGEDNFLKRLARMNGGKHSYVDTTRRR